MKTSKTSNKFILLAHPRSGSTLLTTYLRSHGQILAHGEVFNESDCDLSPVTRPDMSKQELIKERDQDPVKFLSKYVFTNDLEWKEIVGFKIHYQHANNGEKEVWNHLAKDNSIKIIHLTRDNSLETYASLMLAMKTNKWAKINDKPSPRLTLSLDQQECNYFFNRMEKYRVFYNDLFKNHPILDITYDQLYRNKSNTLEQVQQFLEVSMEKLDSDLRKQNKTPLPELIENYDELRRAFEKTRWQHFFSY
ncbi:Stf0 family sulfotransferase [Fulvivirga ulvae]|uniref:Stf0 family sulfotransferase n=1 Tax=Fulvivirga ulvae TaxID=2904245 RepID=UPI001F206ED8|nr:Stf0 family sulfotransferase [Fulvivirga ulvae]UII31043.1 Stf0 family sulfotransferase [Fulvivirga ulvae]